MTNKRAQWLFALAMAVLVVVGMWLIYGCQATLENAARQAAIAAVDRAMEKLGDQLPATPALPQPETPWEGILATLAGTAAIVGHRYLFHKKRKCSGGS